MTDLNTHQRAAADTYGMGDFSYATTQDEAENVGDTLFLFIIRELSDDEGCDSRDEAIRRMEAAKRDIQDVLDALTAE